MCKKLLISTLVFALSLFTFSICCFANNGLQNAAEDVRNVVGGAENAVENAAKDISNTSKNATGNMEKDANNVTDHKMDNNKTSNKSTGTSTGTYNATKTSATGSSTFMGMNATAWTWLILGIAAIAIIALVWYYSMQVRSNNDFDDKN